MANRCGLFVFVLHTDRSLEQRGAFAFLPGYSWCDLQKWGSVLGICSLKVKEGTFFKILRDNLKPGRRGQNAKCTTDVRFLVFVESSNLKTWKILSVRPWELKKQVVLRNKHGCARVQRRPSEECDLACRGCFEVLLSDTNGRKAIVSKDPVHFLLHVPWTFMKMSWSGFQPGHVCLGYMSVGASRFWVEFWEPKTEISTLPRESHFSSSHLRASWWPWLRMCNRTFFWD